MIFFRKYFAVLRMTWIQALEYKSNLIVGLFSILSGVYIEFVIWTMIFATQNVGTIRGFDFENLMAFIFLSLIVGQLKSSWMTSVLMIEEVRTGQLNKYLMRPISYFSYNFTMFIGQNSLFYIAYFLMILAFPFLFPGYIFQSQFSLIGFLLALAVSIYLSYAIYFFMVCFTFWFGEVHSLIIAYNLSNMVFTGQVIPLKLFPYWLQEALAWTPLPYLVDLPVRAATSMISPEEFWPKLALSLAWSVVMYFAGRFVYRLGIRHYGAFGG